MTGRVLDADHSYQLKLMLLSSSKGGAGSYANLLDVYTGFQVYGNFRGRGRCWRAGGAEASWID